MNPTRKQLLLQGIELRFINAKLDNFSKSVKEEVNKKQSLFIHCGVGIGKTHLLSAIVLNAFLELPERNPLNFLTPSSKFPLLTNTSDLLFELRSSYGNFQESEQDIMNKIINSPILCLDDVGSAKPTDWNVEILYRIINKRYNSKMRTYIASNFSRLEIAERFDERIASRIAGMCKTIKLTGKDRRLSENSKK